MLSQYKKYIKFLTIIIFLSFAFKPAFAATLTLTKIGALDLGTKVYNEWWYTGINPTFVGAATPGSVVSLKIGDATYTTTTNSAGVWSYPATMAKGDYVIEISSGAEKVPLTLHLGQNVPDSVSQATTSATGTPTTGFNQFVGVTFGVGIILLATYLYFSTDSKRKAIFENRMLKED
jgi:hypothetical protein